VICFSKFAARGLTDLIVSVAGLILSGLALSRRSHLGSGRRSRSVGFRDDAGGGRWAVSVKVRARRRSVFAVGGKLNHDLMFRLVVSQIYY